MTAFFGFGATPPRQHGSPLERLPCPLVPLCIAPHTLRIAPGGRPFRCPGDVGPEGRLPFVARVFRACAKPVTGPVLCHSRHVPQSTWASGRAGVIFRSLRKKFGCFPPSETPSEFFIRGLDLLGNNKVVSTGARRSNSRPDEVASDKKLRIASITLFLKEKRRVSAGWETEAAHNSLAMLRSQY